MAKQVKKSTTETPAARKVRKPATKKRNTVYTKYAANDKTRPYDELTEEERIAEGTKQPYLEKVSFQKTPEERKAWYKVHSNSKGPISAGVMKVKHNELPNLLVVQFKNHKKNPEFITTHSFRVRESEILSTLDVFFKYKPSEKESKGTPFKKVFFNGKLITV